MTKEQLEELVALGESEQVEFKETTGQREDACETLCAFLNADGGTVVFGVSRKGKLTGQLVSDSTRRDLFEVFTKFEPKPDISTDWIPVDEDHSAIVCHVAGGVRKPYQYGGRAYCRIQSSTTVLSQPDYEAMLYARPAFVKDWLAEIIPDVTPLNYRNPQLVDAMSELNSLKDICWLDRVQKGLPITAEVASYLRKQGWIEGRGSHLRITAKIANEGIGTLIPQEKTQERYRRIFIDFLRKFPGSSRQEINEFMIPNLDAGLSDKQKVDKISNLMTGLRRKGKIENRGTDKNSHWFLQ